MNTDDLNENKNIIGALKRQAATEIEKILWEEGQRIMNESVRICPIDTGRLRASRYVNPVSRENERFVLEMGYSADYALYVHEDLEAQHRPPTQAKYLEQPIRENLPDMQRRILERLVEVYS